MKRQQYASLLTAFKINLMNTLTKDIKGNDLSPSLDLHEDEMEIYINMN